MLRDSIASEKKYCIAKTTTVLLMNDKKSQNLVGKKNKLLLWVWKWLITGFKEGTSGDKGLQCER